MIIEFIRNMRHKSVAERQRYTLLTAVSTTGLIVGIWLTVLIAGDGLGHYRFTKSAVVESDSSDTSKDRWGNLYPGAQSASVPARDELQALINQYSTEDGRLQRAFETQQQRGAESAGSNSAMPAADPLPDWVDSSVQRGDVNQPPILEQYPNAAVSTDVGGASSDYENNTGVLPGATETESVRDSGTYDVPGAPTQGFQ